MGVKKKNNFCIILSDFNIFKLQEIGILDGRKHISRGQNLSKVLNHILDEFWKSQKNYDPKQMLRFQHGFIEEEILRLQAKQERIREKLKGDENNGKI